MSDSTQFDNPAHSLSYISGSNWKQNENGYEVLVPFNKLSALKKILISVMKDGHKNNVEITPEKVHIIGELTENWNRLSIKAGSIDLDKLEKVFLNTFSKEINRSSPIV